MWQQVKIQIHECDTCQKKQLNKKKKNASHINELQLRENVSWCLQIIK